MRYLLMALILGFSMACADDTRVETKDLTDNRKVCLVAARVSMRCGQNLEAKFMDTDGGSAEIVEWFPCHSHTPQETTLLEIIRSCVDWKEPTDAHVWHPTILNAVFSVPKDVGAPHGPPGHYDRWFLVSLKVPTPK